MQTNNILTRHPVNLKLGANQWGWISWGGGKSAPPLSRVKCYRTGNLVVYDISHISIKYVFPS